MISILVDVHVPVYSHREDTPEHRDWEATLQSVSGGAHDSHDRVYVSGRHVHLVDRADFENGRDG